MKLVNILKMIDYNQGDLYYYYWTHPCKWVGERNEVFRLGRARFGVKQHRQITTFKKIIDNDSSNLV